MRPARPSRFPTRSGGSSACPRGRWSRRTSLTQNHDPGDTVDLTLVRDGERQTVSVTLGRFETGQQDSRQRAADTGAVTEEALGFRVEPMSQRVADRLGFDNAEGIVVSGAARYGNAAGAGVRPGMRLLRIDDQEVDSVEDVRSIAREISAGQVISLRVEVPEFGQTVINYRAPQQD